LIAENHHECCRPVVRRKAFAVLLLLLLCVSVNSPRAGAASTATKPASRSTKVRIPPHLARKVDALLSKVDKAHGKAEREQIAVELSQLDKRTAPYLASLFADLKGFRQVVAGKALLAMKSPGALPMMLSELKSRGALANPELMKYLSETHVDDALPLLLQARPKASLETKQAITYCLTYFNTPSCIDAFSEGIDSPDSLIRLYSHLGMGRLLRAYATAEVREVPDWSKRIDKLVQGLDGHLRRCVAARDIPGTVRCIEHLGLTGRRKAAEAVYDCLRDDSPPIRAAAVKAIGRLGPHGQRYTRELLHIIEDDELLVRLQAIEALASLGERAAVPLIARMLYTKDLRTRALAVTALRTLTGKNFGPYPEAWLNWWEKEQEAP